MHKDRRRFMRAEVVVGMVLVAFLLLIFGPCPLPRAMVRTRRTFQALQNALSEYHEKYGAYPPSDDKTIGTGAQCLLHYLMGPREQGWGPDPADGGVPATSRWRCPQHFQDEFVIGGGPGTGTARKFFCDSYRGKERAILYYRANVEVGEDGNRPTRFTDVYNMSDNNGDADGPFWTPSAEEWRKLVLNPGTGDREVPFRPTSYLLIAAGRDREFGTANGKSDNIINWKRQD